MGRRVGRHRRVLPHRDRHRGRPRFARNTDEAPRQGGQPAAQRLHVRYRVDGHRRRHGRGRRQRRHPGITQGHDTRGGLGGLLPRHRGELHRAAADGPGSGLTGE
ncbi:hypothetical protein SBRY_40094 [Actinacidiphila bryophytorum]|uniref:Uncharacterized protein n=1 Tax=Actinacidiphila bryophytorum TaxID=1436133 RepID=A0A9W4H2C4_9ACTN|nr:hypothetical protein SBRY_40094 [Actinacidiphila bryophytorum]